MTGVGQGAGGAPTYLDRYWDAIDQIPRTRRVVVCADPPSAGDMYWRAILERQPMQSVVVRIDSAGQAVDAWSEPVSQKPITVLARGHR